MTEQATANAEAVIEAQESVSLTEKPKRKKRDLKLSKNQKKQIKHLRFADRVGIIFGDDNIKVSRADSIRLVEKGKATVQAAYMEGSLYCTVSLVVPEKPVEQTEESE